MRVASVGFSPVKGTRHLAYDEVRLDAAGVVGDREYCLVDVAARRVLRTVQYGSLVAVEARAGETLAVSLPDGTCTDATPVASGSTLICEYWGRPVTLELLDGPHGALFSRHLGTPVRLARAPRRGVVYGAGVTLVTTGSLADLGRRSGVGVVGAARFRPSVVVEEPEPYAEERWHGRLLAIGEATVRVGLPVPRCAVIDLSPTRGERDLRLLRELTAHRPLASTSEPIFGMYAEVVEPGVVRAGDAVTLRS